MQQKIRKLILRMAGSTGALLISLAALAVTFLIDSKIDSSLLVNTAVLLTIVRGVYRISRGPHPLLHGHTIRKRLSRLLVDEAYIAVFLLAAAYVWGRPSDRPGLALFLTLNLALQVSFMYLFRHMFSRWSRKSADSSDGSLGNVARDQALIVGTGPLAKTAADAVLDAPETDTLLAGFLDFERTGFWRYRDVPLIGHPDSLRDIIATCQVDALIIALEADQLHFARTIRKTADEMGINVCLLPEILYPCFSDVQPGYLNGLPALICCSRPGCQMALLTKAALDRLGALVGLIFATPIMVAAAAAIKLTSRGPVFFRQTRCGINGKPFRLLKFRTMGMDAEGKKNGLEQHNEMSGPVFKIRNDPRVTKVGRVLRKTSIDEVPQFLNVLRGDMSLVGPRPPLPKEVAAYEPWQHRRLSVKPGITCLWQVNGRNAVDFEHWMRLDLDYIDNWSLLMDAKILARTIPAVIRGEGAS